MMPRQTIFHIGRIARRLLLGVLLLAAVLVWVGSTESALRLGAQWLERASHGNLVLQGVQGSLYGTLQVQSLRYSDGSRRYEATGLHLDWAPLALLSGRLQINALSIKELRVSGSGSASASGPAAALPKDLLFPLWVSVSKLQLDRVVIKTGDAEYVLSHVLLSLGNAADGYTLHLSSASTPWGDATAEFTLGATAPFATAGQVTLAQAAVQAWPYQVGATVSGTLSRMAVALVADSKGARAVGDVTLAPFDEHPIRHLRLDAKDIDPARLQAGLPKAAISVDLLLDGKDAGKYEGSLALRNALPGPLDSNRLPFRALTTDLAGTLAQLAFVGLRLDLASAGQFTGSGGVEQARLRLALKTGNFNPKGMHSRMRAMKLAGTIQLGADAMAQQVKADLRYQGYQLVLDALHRDQAIEIKNASLLAGDASVRLHGRMGLQAPRRLQLDGELKNFDPAAFGDYPAARVNATLNATALMDAAPEATLRFELHDSLFRQQPLTGKGRLHLTATRLLDSAVSLRLAQNRLEMHGSLGQDDDELTLLIDAPRLDALSPDLAGRLRLSGTVGGGFMAPSGAIELQAQDLRWRKDLRVRRLQAKGQLHQGAQGAVELEIDASDIATPAGNLDSARVSGRGLRTQHSLDLTAKSAALDFHASLNGGWSDQAGWTGRLATLGNRGKHSFELKGPAALALAPNAVLLSDARFDVAGAALNVQELAYQAGLLSSRGEFKGLAVSYLQKLFPRPSELKTDLVLGGHWQFSANDRINGQLVLARERGDIFLPTRPETALGLQQLDVEVNVLDNRIHALLSAAGGTLGSLKVDLQTLLSQRDGVWGVAGSAPLQMDAELSVKSLAWVAPLINESGALALDGTLQANIQARGSLAQPELTGRIEGQRLSVDLREQGVRLREGHFLAQFQGDRLQLISLGLRAGKGSLTGSGHIALKAGDADLQLTLNATELEVLSRPDRQLVVSGTGRVELADRKLRVTAKLKADRGLIELPKGDTPSPSDDVVVSGQEEGLSELVRRPQSLDRNFEFDLDLGDSFYLKGRGLDAQLGGVVKLSSVGNAPPRANGSIRIIRGAYAAYGQRLEIVRGVLNFQGPADNPGLNIVAMRRRQEVEAGVSITGNAMAPQVKLVSSPNVPDSEKLSWLVLGHGMDSTSGAEFNALQLAAGALLSAGESLTLQQRIAQSTGLEDINVRGAGTVESTVLTIGKRVSSRAYVSYERGLTGAQNLAKITYTLTKRLSLRAQEGDTTALDLFYTFSFD